LQLIREKGHHANFFARDWDAAMNSYTIENRRRDFTELSTTAETMEAFVDICRQSSDRWIESATSPI
jgi:hypothetical protein